MKLLRAPQLLSAQSQSCTCRVQSCCGGLFCVLDSLVWADRWVPVVVAVMNVAERALRLQGRGAGAPRDLPPRPPGMRHARRCPVRVGRLLCVPGCRRLGTTRRNAASCHKTNIIKSILPVATRASPTQLSIFTCASTSSRPMRRQAKLDCCIIGRPQLELNR